MRKRRAAGCQSSREVGVKYYRSDGRMVEAKGVPIPEDMPDRPAGKAFFPCPDSGCTLHFAAPGASAPSGPGGVCQGGTACGIVMLLLVNRAYNSIHANAAEPIREAVPASTQGHTRPPPLPA